MPAWLSRSGVGAQETRLTDSAPPRALTIQKPQTGLLDPDERAREARVRQKFGTFSIIEICEELPCEVIPAQGRKAGPFSADEELFFAAGYAMMTTNDAPDSFADLMPQPAESMSTKGSLRPARATAVFVAASWSKVRGCLARTSVILTAFVAALWLKVRGPLVRTSVTLAALSATLWSKVRGFLVHASVGPAALGMLAGAKVKQVITRRISSLVRHFETRWRRHRDGGIVLCESHGTVRRGPHNTLLGYPVLSRRR